MNQVINYNPMLMMLYNLKPNILVISKGSSWDENEVNLINEAVKLQQQNPQLTVAMMNMETIESMEEGTFSLNTMVHLAKKQSPVLEYFINYWVQNSNNQSQMFASMKSLLNIQKVIINPDFNIGNEPVNKKALGQIFGENNVTFIDYVFPGKKLAEIKAALASGNVKKYAAETKTKYQIKGAVVHGKELGRQLGFPTANLKVNPNLQLKQGVYYTKVKLPNIEEPYDGMSCYWINENNDHVIETYLFNFNKDIYGWFIQLQFQDYIRDNVIVSSQEELIKLLKQDEQWIKKHYQ